MYYSPRSETLKKANDVIATPEGYNKLRKKKIVSNLDSIKESPIANGSNYINYSVPRFLSKGSEFYVSSPKFYLVSVLIHLYLLFFSVWYSLLGSMNNLDDYDDNISGHSHKNDDDHINLSIDGIATVSLIGITILFILSTFLKWTEPLQYDHVLLIVIIWILIGTFLKYENGCNNSDTTNIQPSNSSISYSVPKQKDKLVLEINGKQLVVFNSFCKSMNIIKNVYNLLMIVIIICLYMSIKYENDLHALIKTLYKIEGTRVNSLFLWKIVPSIIFGFIVFIPINCNNPTIMGSEQFILRIAIFSVLLLLRLLNAYCKTYFMKKTIYGYLEQVNKTDSFRVINDKENGFHIVPDNKIDFKSIRTDVNLSEVKVDSDNEDEYLTINENVIKNARHYINRSRKLNRAVDLIAASSVLVLCGYYLLISLIQLGIEFFVLYFNIRKYERHIDKLQHLFCGTSNV
jgi:hypothetical protein